MGEHADERSPERKLADRRSSLMGGAMTSLRYMRNRDEWEDHAATVYRCARLLAGKTDWPLTEPAHVIVDESELRAVVLTSTLQALQGAVTRNTTSLGPDHPRVRNLLNTIAENALVIYVSTRAMRLGKVTKAPPWREAL